jgi:hypothetical protein
MLAYLWQFGRVMESRAQEYVGKKSRNNGEVWGKDCQDGRGHENDHKLCTYRRDCTGSKEDQLFGSGIW